RTLNLGRASHLASARLCHQSQRPVAIIYLLDISCSYYAQAGENAVCGPGDAEPGPEERVRRQAAVDAVRGASLGRETRTDLSSAQAIGDGRTGDREPPQRARAAAGGLHDHRPRTTC